jgi:3-deoxy-D-manno-octulosonic-acid transferase
MWVAIGLLWPIWVPMVCSREKYRRSFSKRAFGESMPPTDSASPGARGRIWIHALSVGEVMSAVPLVQALSRNHGAGNLIFTASTRTGVETAEREIAGHVAAVRYFPYDLLWCVKRAIDRFAPRQVIIVETDIWPNFLWQLQRRRIPVYLVNARLSDRSWRGYRRVRWLMSPLLAIFARICVQTESDRRRFRVLGVEDEKLMMVGNLKFDQASIDLAVDDLKRLSRQLALPAERSVWLAGSTHPGEEEIILQAYRQVEANGLAPLLIVVPRDPTRAAHVRRIFRRSGVAAATMSQIERQLQPSPVVVVDRLGVLRPLCALADVAFVGGSLVDAGGHNPLEPAAAGTPVLLGPHTGDFRWICQTLVDAGGALRVHDATELAQAVSQLIGDRERRQRMGRCAFGVFIANRGALARTLAIVDSESRSVMDSRSAAND